MDKISFREKIKIPRYDDPIQIKMGLIKIEEALCNGCQLCIRACPANAILLKDKKAHLSNIPECMACGDCVAICPQEAITLVKNYKYTGYFKTIDKGDLQPPRFYGVKDD